MNIYCRLCFPRWLWRCENVRSNEHGIQPWAVIWVEHWEWKMKIEWIWTQKWNQTDFYILRFSEIFVIYLFVYSPRPTPTPFGFHDGPTPLKCSAVNWLIPRDIRLAVVMVSRLERTQLGRWLSCSNFGMYGSNILILPQRWINSPIAPIQSSRTSITMKASSGRMIILFPVEKGEGS